MRTVVKIASWAFAAVLALAVLNMTGGVYNKFAYSPDEAMRGEGFWKNRKSATAHNNKPVIPAQLPGPLDSWSGSESKSIIVISPLDGDQTVVLKLIESHESEPPLISLRACGNVIAEWQVEKGRGSPVELWRSTGHPSVYKADIPGRSLAACGGEIQIRSEQGSWAAIDQLLLYPKPKTWEVWTFIPSTAAYVMLWGGLFGLWASLAAGASYGADGLDFRKAAMYLVMTFFACALAITPIGLIAVYVELKTPSLAYSSGRVRAPDDFFVRDRELGWKMVPSYVAHMKNPGDAGSYPYFISNTWGFRSTGSETGPPQKGEAIMVGDSYVQGMFLAQHETIHRKLLEKLGGHVFGLGASGYSTDQEYTLLKRVIGKINAKYVIVMFSPNDLLFLDKNLAYGTPKPVYEIKDGIVNFELLHPLPDDLLKDQNRAGGKETFCCFPKTDHNSLLRRFTMRTLSYLAALYDPVRLVTQIRNDIALTKVSYDLRTYLVPYGKYEKPDALNYEWGLAFQFLGKMKELAESRGMKFAVFFIPEVAQVMNASGHERFYLQKSFMKFCESNKMDCIEPTQAFVKRQRMVDVFFMDDGHFNPYGAEMAADIISEHLEKARVAR
jgi:hypothetical protein